MNVEQLPLIAAGGGGVGGVVGGGGGGGVVATEEEENISFFLADREGGCIRKPVDGFRSHYVASNAAIFEDLGPSLMLKSSLMFS